MVNDSDYAVEGLQPTPSDWISHGRELRRHSKPSDYNNNSVGANLLQWTQSPPFSWLFSLHLQVFSQTPGSCRRRAPLASVGKTLTVLLHPCSFMSEEFCWDIDQTIIKHRSQQDHNVFTCSWPFQPETFWHTSHWEVIQPFFLGGGGLKYRQIPECCISADQKL